MALAGYANLMMMMMMMMSALVLVSINLHTKFEAPSFSHFKDMFQSPKFNKKLCYRRRTARCDVLVRIFAKCYTAV